MGSTPEDFPPGDIRVAVTNRADARLFQAGMDKQEVIRHHLEGRWDAYRGETHLVERDVQPASRFSLCYTGPETCVMIGERAGILTLCCPDDSEGFTPPPGGPH